MLLKAETGGYAVYIIVKIGLAIGVAIALGIITIIVILVLLLPVGGIGVAAVLGGMAAGLTWNAYTITLAVIVCCLVLAALIFVASMISVPAIVFFPAYSIYFFRPRAIRPWQHCSGHRNQTLLRPLRHQRKRRLFRRSQHLSAS